MYLFVYVFGMYILILLLLCFINYIGKCPSSLLFHTPVQLVAVMHLKAGLQINKRRRRNFRICLSLFVCVEYVTAV